MVRRAVLVASLAALLLLVLPALPAGACHFGPTPNSGTCPPDGAPSSTPFDPQLQVSVRPSVVSVPGQPIAGNVDFLITQQDHEKIPNLYQLDFPAGWPSSLASPGHGEQVGAISAIVKLGPGRQTATVNGKILDHNDHAGHPTGSGEYHYTVQLDPTPGVPGTLFGDNIFADLNSGHLRFRIIVPDEAISAAGASDLSIVSVDFAFAGAAGGGTFLNNPSTSGVNTFGACEVGLSIYVFPPFPSATELKCQSSAVTVEARTPTFLAMSPVSTTRPVGTIQTELAVVQDQIRVPMAGVSVTFSVAGANPQAPVAVLTDSAGQASFSYTGLLAGLDTITATAGSLSANATVNWTTGSTGGFSQTFTPPSLTTPCTVGGDHNDLLGFGSASHAITPDATTGGIDIVGSAQQTVVPIGVVIAGLHIFASDTDFGGGNCVGVTVPAGTYLVTTTIQVITPTVSALPATPLGRESAAVDALVLASSSISSSTASQTVACTGSCSATGPGTFTMTTALAMPLPGTLTAGGLLRTRVSALGAGTASAHGTGTVLSVTVTQV